MIVNNLPAGLGITLTRDSDTSITIGFNGHATDHREESSTNNVSVTIPKTKMTGSLTNLTTEKFAINFTDPARVYILEAEVLEPNPYDTGAISGTLTVHIVNGSFAADLSANDIMVNNLPNDLEVTLTRNSATELSIGFTGNALVHENADDVFNASITLFKEKLLGTNNNITTNTFKINYNEPEPTMAVAVSEIRESEENDGSLVGIQTVTLAHGTFAADISEEDVTVSGLPEGLNITNFTRISDMQLSIGFSGNALDHTEEDSITNVNVQVFANKINPNNVVFIGNEFPIASNSFKIK